MNREARTISDSKPVKAAFQQFTAHQSTIEFSEAHTRDCCHFHKRVTP